MMKEQAIASVAQDLLTSLGASLTERSKKELEAVAAQAEEHTDSCRATVSRPGKDSYWSGDGELNVRFNGSNIETEEETGDVYRTYTLKFDITWSSHNEQVGPDTLGRLHMMVQLATVGAALSEKYSQTFRTLVYTAAQVEERKVAAEKAELVRKVKTLAEYAVKGLRVNSNRREVARSMFTNIPDGTYEVSYTNNYDTKVYGVRLTQYGAFLTRKS